MAVEAVGDLDDGAFFKPAASSSSLSLSSSPKASARRVAVAALDASEAHDKLGECAVPASGAMTLQEAKAAFAADQFVYQKIPDDLSMMFK